MLQSCFLQIAISQDGDDGFQISQSLWVKQALEHILILNRLHSRCKQSFCVTKCPKTVLFQQFHICMTVRIWHFFRKVSLLLLERSTSRKKCHCLLFYCLTLFPVEKNTHHIVENIREGHFYYVQTSSVRNAHKSIKGKRSVSLLHVYRAVKVRSTIA